ncbi:MAG: hypothetical protein UW22_C0002G0013 [Candidatus Gottesmanbacteria bacterium GW2011_GWB1_44_11c]|uniref:Uncharacterized protein n=2 Tax=Candidatus Gottesmaniibacteriota TaxID=1752720 RepID=A0A0G1LNN7_9BACT|nr:MAG: hypothetical protein UW22_C0002G0013 [Candidatus Gottesmanbacteria bacterium GW2011_GWB1_44_11c]KKT61499.1 MAG: hypothetical protein UW52_C0002G0013 [Candidatus Gottesmanbacteria bacterium GW2011_GWA1_44_24b]HCM81896.1 hypothetical protein [Patescibacteria group bacterium]
MDTKDLGTGIYAGVTYHVIEKGGKKYISPDPNFLSMFTQNGANLHLLDDIGDKDPDEVMEALFATMKKPE